MAAGRDDRSSQLEQPLLYEREESFKFPFSAPKPDFLTVDVGSDGGSIFSPRNSFHVDDAHPEAHAVPDTPGHFRCNSPLYRDAEETCSGEVLHSEDAKKPEDQKEKVRRAQIRRSLRNPITKKSFVKRAAFSATTDPIHFLKTVLWGLVLWPKWAWDAMVSQMSLTIISLKSGFAAGLASVICVVNFPPPYDGLSSIAIWAVVTIDLLYEGNIGLSLSKGVNRVAGTLAAGTAAVFLTRLGPDVPKHLYSYYTVLWVFLGGFGFRFLKGIPPLKDQWGYAFTVATIAFHILLLTSYLQPERVTLPLLRCSMIVLGFLLGSIVNLAFKPAYAGDSLHKLVAKNFDTAADVLQRCVTEYANYTMLDHVPDILSGRSEDDKIHQTYHEIVMSDSDVDKLLGAVTWEPCHGAFFTGYPWHLYDDITDYLRYTLYDVIALDSCLRASIQAPKDLRDLFSQEMKLIAEECSKVLHILGESMRTMTTFDSDDILRKAEEAAIELQNKIYIHTHLLLGKGAAESPRYHLYVASCPGVGTSSVDDGNFDSNDPWATSEAEYRQSRTADDETAGTRPRPGVEELENGITSSPPLAIPKQDDQGTDGDYARSEGGSRPYDPSYETEDTSWQDSPHLSRSTSIHYSPKDSGEGADGHRSRRVSLVRKQGTQSVSQGMQIDDGSVNGDFIEPKERVKKVSKLKKPPKGWKHTFKKRRSNLGTEYDGAEERISALSLVKFASLLIEVLVKMKYVVASVVELGEAARFKHHTTNEPSLRDGIM